MQIAQLYIEETKFSLFLLHDLQLMIKFISLTNTKIQIVYSFLEISTPQRFCYVPHPNSTISLDKSQREIFNYHNVTAENTLRSYLRS